MRALYIDCQVCFQVYREVVEKINIEFSKTIEAKNFENDIHFYPVNDEFKKNQMILEDGIYSIEKLNLYFDYIFIQNKELVKIIPIVENFFTSMKSITSKLHETDFSNFEEIKRCLSFIQLKLINCEQDCDTIILFIQNVIGKLDLDSCD